MQRTCRLPLCRGTRQAMSEWFPMSVIHAAAHRLRSGLSDAASAPVPESTL